MNENAMRQMDFWLKSTSDPHSIYVPEVDSIDCNPIVLSPLPQKRVQVGTGLN